MEYQIGKIFEEINEKLDYIINLLSEEIEGEEKETDGRNTNETEKEYSQ